ncbi:MAG: serine O-acetyltransferase EpsC [Spirochaetota bacterium]|nr:serine O-acetyltransferase EpsC [Spirochaetota bacterium]
MKRINDLNNDSLIEQQINKILDHLCEPKSYKSVYHRSNHAVPMPSIEDLQEVMELIRSVLFPGYFGNSDVKPVTMKYYLGAAINRIFIILSEQIKRGFCFSCVEGDNACCDECEDRSRNITQQFLNQLPHLRSILSVDINAAYQGDPAANSVSEVIFCYPTISALIHYRIAHALHKLDVPIIPRIITEMAHSATGIDIHPGAVIGESLFIDHGTGVVIGETCIIGCNVRIYQGVTLGAKSFPLDSDGQPIKGIPRHPIVEDDVIIYSGATILGRVTIGQGSVIGGNVWLTKDVPPGTRILQSKATESIFEQGAGI